MANFIDALTLWLLQLHLVIKCLFFKEAADVFGAVQEEFVQKLILQHRRYRNLQLVSSWHPEW